MLVGVGASILAVAPSAHAAVTPGQGSAYAQGLQVAPHDGSLAVGVTLAEALAGHTNGVARAQSQGIDLGAIGTSMTSYNCGSQAFKPDQIPQSLQTETGSDGAAQGIRQSPDPSAGASQPSFGTDEFVKATPAPYGEADTSLPPVETPAFRVDGMATKAWSGLVDGQRVAGATSTIGGLDIANGVVDLTNLRWETQSPSGGTTRPSGSFTMGGAAIHGTPLPGGTSLAAVQDAVNAALGTVGLELKLPVATLNQGVESVSPLQVMAVPNDTRDGVLNLGLNATEAQQQTVFGGLENGFSPAEPAQLAQALCQSDTPITIAQIAVASVNGGGFFSAALGGVNSSSSDVSVNPYSLGGFTGALGGTLGAGGSGPLGSSSPVLSTAGGAASGALTTGAGGGATAGASPLAGAAPVAPTGSSAAAPSGMTPASATAYSAGGPLLAIGLAGLGLLGLLAEADRRMMRRAQQTLQFQE